MAEPSKPTLEDLQAELVALKDKQTENDAKITALSEENKKLSDDLEKARELNTKLFLRLPNDAGGSQQEPPQEEDSFEKLVDETIEKRILSKQKTS